jgi:aspartate/methionine/tyrosine aminotransferase
MTTYRQSRSNIRSTTADQSSIPVCSGFDGLESALTARTRLIVYTSPSNPLGWVADATEQQALLDFCRCNKLWLLADEVYERIYYTGTVAPSILRTLLALH